MRLLFFQFFIQLVVYFSGTAPLSSQLRAPTCRGEVSTFSGKFVLPVSIHHGFPELADEREMRRSLDASFLGFSINRRDLGVEGVIEGEKEYRKARLRANLPALSPIATADVWTRPHPYWEIGVQAFVITAWMENKRKIAAAAEAMAYLLHDLDDIADRYFTDFLSRLSPIEFLKPTDQFLQAHYPAGYAELYRDILERVVLEIPHFDRRAFDRATLRMIEGGVLLSDRVLRANREKFQFHNKRLHVEMLEDHPSIQMYLSEEVSNVYYSFTVKSLPDGIFSFFEQKDGKAFSPGLMVLFGIVTAPGLVLENVEEEQSNGEFSSEGALLTIQEVKRTCQRAAEELSKAAERNEFRLVELIAFRDVYIAYGNAFERILRAKDLWTTYEIVLLEVQKSISRYR